ncbi:MAG: RcpC/CpaB family pilus assembly protein [Peptococcaceae bacterium]|jgi:Flp pilus assembly protein CpaB|nr:RcpC/CpaB family pilus assembly protein [Peptococcaceae bacterium]
MFFKRPAVKTEKKNNLYFIAALGLAVLAGLMIYASVSAALNEKEVLVAAKEIKPGDKITSALVVKEKRPGAAIPQDALNVEEIDAGYTAAANVAPGDVIRKAHAADLKIAGGNLTARTALLGPGYRAVALPADSTAGLLLEPGDKLDVVGVVDVPTQGGAETRSKVVVSAAPVVYVPPLPDPKDPAYQEARVVVAVKEELFPAVALAVTKGKVYAGVNAGGEPGSDAVATANSVFGAVQ